MWGVLFLQGLQNVCMYVPEEEEEGFWRRKDEI
jgi:hypothetical protein